MNLLLSLYVKNLYFKKLLYKLRLTSKPRTGYGWFGNHAVWQSASALTGGYYQAGILEKTRQSLLKVKSGDAVYERDSVLFAQKQYPYPLIACMLHVASSNNNTLRVIDFGGSLGSTWYQVRDFLTPLHEISWHVVEQENYVTCGKVDFEDEVLKFHYTLKDSIATGMPHVILLSSVVQYLDNPHLFLEEVVSLAPAYIIVDRTAFIDAGDDRLTVQHVDPVIYEASYPSWFFNRERFFGHFEDYTCLAEFASYVEGETILNIDGKPQGKDKGFFFKRKI